MARKDLKLNSHELVRIEGVLLSNVFPAVFRRTVHVIRVLSLFSSPAFSEELDRKNSELRKLCANLPRALFYHLVDILPIHISPQIDDQL